MQKMLFLVSILNGSLERIYNLKALMTINIDETFLFLVDD